MFYSVITIILGVVTIALFILYKKSQRPANLPPGPPTIPFIGNLNHDQNKLLKYFREYVKTYGDVFSLVMGAKTVVVINRLETMKEFFVKNADVTSERPDIFVFSEIGQGMGIASSSGHTWKTQRTFALSVLREFGFGKRSLESKILEEVQVVVEDIRERCGKPFNPSNLLHISVSNIMCSIIFGKRFEYTDKRFTQLMDRMSENFSNPVSVGLMTFLPFIRYIPGDLFRVKRLLHNVVKVEEHLMEFIDEHRKTYDESVISDFVYAYIKKINDEKSNNGVESTFTDKQLLKVITDLFAAGTETTATTLRWFILFCIRNPGVQEKMGKEIKDVIGESRLPKIEDRTSLPYCEAVITETLRLGNIVPFSIPHGVTQDIEFKGYHIPKDTVIMPNLDSVLLDPEVFPNPFAFDPSRFLNEQGQLTDQDKVLPFSLGRRVCLGESLARMELFLFTTSIIQRYRLLPETDGDTPDLDGVLGISHSPKPYSFRAVEV